MKHGLLTSVAKIAVSISALWLVFRGLDPHAVVGALEAAPKGGLAAGFALYLASQAVSAFRWRHIVLGSGIELGGYEALRYYFTGMFFNLLGLGLLGGDAARSMYLSRHGGGARRAVATVVADRYAGLVWLAVLASAAVFALGRQELPLRLAVVVHGFAFVLLASWFCLPTILQRFPRIRAAPRADQGGDVIGWWRDPRSRRRVVSRSLLIHLLQIGAAIALVVTLVPGCPWQYCFVFHPLVALLSALPVSVAGLGVRETSYVVFLTLRPGVMREDAAVFAIAWLAIVLAAAALGGLVFILSGDALPRRGPAPGQSPASQPPRSS